jgi:tetratricopeptide (TPR) repeat protein
MFYNTSIKHNLACYYHIQALQYKNEGNSEEFKKSYMKAKETFEKAINIKTSKPVNIALYVEYSQFLIKYHNKNNVDEYSNIIRMLTKAIDMQDDGSTLSYNQIEKSTTTEAIQKLLNTQGKLEIRPSLLAYHLLIKIYTTYGKLEEAREVLDNFQAISMSLEDTTEDEIAKSLFAYSNRELQESASRKIQHTWRNYIQNKAIGSNITIPQIQ